jgi:hydroxymethylbilane synthase
MRSPIRVGTRGSQLALAQAESVVGILKKTIEGVRYEVVPIRTAGDRAHESGSSTIKDKSAFTKEIEYALLARDVDLAVHSMKDLTTEQPKGLIIGAVPPRENPRDALVSRKKETFQALPGGARIGTSSNRRIAQLLAARNDLEIVDMHGNVDTRLRKLERGECDAIVLAAAGLIRLGLEKHATEFLSTEIMLPAVGQGALAIECRETDPEVQEMLVKVDDRQTRSAVGAERAFAQRLGANCRTPIAAYAKTDSQKLTIDGMVAATSGRMLVRGRLVGSATDSEKVGVELAELLLNKGAGAILEAG